MNRHVALIIICTSLTVLAGCKKSSQKDTSKGQDTGNHAHKHGPDGHTHEDGTTHDHDDAHEHSHDEVELGTVVVGDATISLAQGHGKVEPGKECHLVVKLPYNDKGATIVRAWLGGEDRTLSMVGKGEYAAAHDDYDIHAMAPSPLPDNVMWWIEIQKPDGTKAIGSITPLM